MKPETEIRNLKKELREETRRAVKWEREAKANKFHADTANRESKEWERRFDIAMSKIPDVIQ